MSMMIMINNRSVTNKVCVIQLSYPINKWCSGYFTSCLTQRYLATIAKCAVILIILTLLSFNPTVVMVINIVTDNTPLVWFVHFIFIK